MSSSETQLDTDSAPPKIAMEAPKSSVTLVEEVGQQSPLDTHQMYLQHRESAFFPSLNGLGDQSHSADRACGLAYSTDASDLEDDPADSFDFLARFTTNDSGMSDAFDVDSTLVAQDPSSVGEDSWEGLSDRSSYPVNEARSILFEQHSKTAREHTRQINLDSLGMEEFQHVTGTLEMELSKEEFCVSPPFEIDVSNPSPVGPPSGSWHRKPSSCSEPISSGTLSSALALKSHEIVVAIKATARRRGSAAATSAMGDWSTLKESACVHFFQPSNLQRYLEYYWVLWYPNWPTIHKPSFNAATCPCRLLAPMAVIGASLSPHRSDRENAKVWFDMLEEVVFADEAIFPPGTSVAMPSCPPDQLEARLHSLQAAYAVCLFQTWEGRDTTAKERIRRRRFGSLVSTARCLMRHANHGQLGTYRFQDFSWQTFVLREQVIRTVMYVFLLDTAFTIFNNLPPRMIIREMTNDLACPEPCFQAATAQECFDQIRQWTARPRHPACTSLYAAIRCFRQRTIDPATQRSLAETGVLNLWTIVSAFHNYIFHIDPGFGSESQVEAMENAIANWRVIWKLGLTLDGSRGSRKSATTTSTESNQTAGSGLDSTESWKRTGFMRKAPEYWLLAQVKLKRLSSAQRSLEAAESLSGINSWLCNVPGTILPRYDETSMEQLSDFISSFGAMRV
ncbi:hypothetical protein AYO20_06393 [Fonsecaea nubica]|uniref:Xylanolytic transcriptional activator regulatory domain-containing protein n=1 Tax=Fonsecaea nubica TaxID=856822 RepID=A0A178CWS6_9EURO|nr:hypothetical protein AYO20_06393 [Fonsecaea nubica]OAL34340.1 hypothetical protein AYO20_06393 [Fonsecaea nubica]